MSSIRIRVKNGNQAYPIIIGRNVLNNLKKLLEINKFTSGIADRTASVRIGNETIKNKCGYFEDRRPSSNCDPFLVTSHIFETTHL